MYIFWAPYTGLDIYLPRKKLSKTILPNFIGNYTVNAIKN